MKMCILVLAVLYPGINGINRSNISLYICIYNLRNWEREDWVKMQTRTREIRLAVFPCKKRKKKKMKRVGHAFMDAGKSYCALHALKQLLVHPGWSVDSGGGEEGVHSHETSFGWNTVDVQRVTICWRCLRESTVFQTCWNIAFCAGPLFAEEQLAF